MMINNNDKHDDKMATPPSYRVKNYFDRKQFWIVRTDGNFATDKPFRSADEAHAYAASMDVANFR